MFGSSSIFFYQSKSDLLTNWSRIYDFLVKKSYSLSGRIIYEKAYISFGNNPSHFDGATLVKDLYDIHGLDLDAMLHDYHYIVYNAGANFMTKWRVDFMYFQGNKRKGKGLYNSLIRFIGLTISGIGFVPYAFIKRGKVTKFQKDQIKKDYRILITNLK